MSADENKDDDVELTRVTTLTNLLNHSECDPKKPRVRLKMADFQDGNEKNGGISMTDVSAGGGSTVGSKAVLTSHHDLPPEEVKKMKFKIIKNLIIVSFAFLCNFTAFQSLSNLQSSLNKVDGLGTASLSVVYAALVISCLFLPPVMIKNIGCKWSIAISFVPYVIYTAANFYAQWYTLIPAAILLGLGAAPLWSAKCTYLTETGIVYARLTGETSEAVVNRFFGVFFMIFQTGQVWGNLVSSFVLQGQPNNTDSLGSSDVQQCGAEYCQQELNISTFAAPELTKVYTLCGIYVACGCVAILIIIFLLDKIVRAPGTELEEVDGKKVRFSLNLLIATIRHLKHKRQLLLIPLTFYSGLEQGFLAGDYTRAFVSCSLGIWMVGFIIIAFGVVNAVCSMGFGHIIKYTGRIPVFCLAALVNYGVQITMLLWQPDPNLLVVFFVLAGLWGLSDAVWQTQINALYGCIFKTEQEAAFANYRLWESLGFILAFAYSEYLCVYEKIYVLIGVLTLGMIGYAIVEIIERRKDDEDD